MTTKSISYYIAITGLVLLASCGKKKEVADASGTFEATELIVSSEATGKLMAFDVQEGQAVAAGQQVGYIDSMQLSLRKSQILSSMKALEIRRPDTRKQIAAIEQQIVTAKSEKRRVENLLKANAANQKQLDDINAQISLLEKQLDAQKSTLSITDRGIGGDAEALGYQVDQLTDQLNKCLIINPSKGIVLVKYAEAGEVAVPGKALYKVADLDQIFLRAYITSAQLTQIKLGQNVKVFADFGEDSKREYAGTISWISAKSEFTPKTIQTQDERANLVYAVKVRVQNDGYLKIGMYGGFNIAD
jgi:HlyD family secretion protein